MVRQDGFHLLVRATSKLLLFNNMTLESFAEVKILHLDLIQLCMSYMLAAGVVLVLPLVQ